jgi:hypothetical protein
LSLSDPNVLLWALKPADDGSQKGVIARVWNVSSNLVGFSLKLSSSRIIGATETTHIETPLKSATVTNGMLECSLPSQGMRTFAITSWRDVLQGDINGDGQLNLGDAILTLGLMSGIESPEVFHKEGDVNGDGRAGNEEVIWILQKISGLR